MKSENIEKAYALAKERYAALGVNTDKAIETLEKTPISLHCWQADDVVGFERNVAASGGIMTTGNFPGRARNIDELRQDIDKATSLLAGPMRLNLHETTETSAERLWIATSVAPSISRVGWNGPRSAA